jgi:hypothetical protein
VDFGAELDAHVLHGEKGTSKYRIRQRITTHRTTWWPVRDPHYVVGSLTTTRRTQFERQRVPMAPKSDTKNNRTAESIDEIARDADEREGDAHRARAAPDSDSGVAVTGLSEVASPGSRLTCSQSFGSSPRPRREDNGVSTTGGRCSTKPQSKCQFQ